MKIVFDGYVNGDYCFLRLGGWIEGSLTVFFVFFYKSFVLINETDFKVFITVM